MRCEHGRSYGFESRHPRHSSSMLYKLALSESGYISGKFVGNLLLPIREGLLVIRAGRKAYRIDRSISVSRCFADAYPRQQALDD